MVNFLLKRPIAVSMSFLAILILGLAAITRLPVSLMPDIDVPKISVHVSYPNHSAGELEQVIARPLRLQLMQVSHLNDLRSESSDGGCIIELEFEHGIDIDFTFIEVNEKIDRAMNSLPRELARPRVVKASATDIPVFYLNITLRNPETKMNTNELFSVPQAFADLSNFSGHVIKKRIEQLQEVAMVDVSGQVFPELLILPHMQKLEALNISLSDIENAINRNNISLGNLLIRDGQYQYNIRFSSTIQSKSDIEDIYLKIDNRLLQLKDIAKVLLHPAKRKGLVTSSGEDAISMAVIKQSDAQMRVLKQRLNELIASFEEDYPDVKFEVTRNQTQLLDYTLSNMGQSLVLGALFAFLIMFIFLKDFKSPLLIGITIPTSLIISLLLFYLLRISINIISISGLILGIGMMIDNSIIVIDNITQHKDRLKNNGNNDQSIISACVQGTNEVFRPLLSSVLTTCAVFIPLVFISGISGALFYDQAIAIAIGLSVSLLVSITLLPVYYRLFYAKRNSGRKSEISKIRLFNCDKLYKKGFRVIMKNQASAGLLFLLIVVAAIPLYMQLDKRKLPTITKDEVLLHINWNENIHIDENNKRIKMLVEGIKKQLNQYTGFMGNQQFLLGTLSEMTASEAVVYLKAKSTEDLNEIIQQLPVSLKDKYPRSISSFSDAGNIFDLLFSNNSAPLVARLRATQDLGKLKNRKIEEVLREIKQAVDTHPIEPIPWKEHTVIEVSPEKLMAYDISFETISQALKSAFNENEVLTIAGSQQLTPVVIGNKPQLISNILDELLVQNGKGEMVRVRSLLTETKGQSLKTIIAGREGEYYPINFYIEEYQAPSLVKSIKNVVTENNWFDVDFDGTIYSNKKMVTELVIILLISLLLLYFILASQFESLYLPFIVLLEVPIDVTGALLLLWLFGESLNIMSIIGIITMSGIIINDSILKIDTINQLRRQGMPLIKALSVAGQRRLKPILMTSLTTILALLPFLLFSGMGADLQRPLALSVIGGMLVGTLVSLYFIPLFYYLIKGKNARFEAKNNDQFIEKCIK